MSFELINFFHRQLALLGIDTLPIGIIACGDILEKLRPDFEQGRLTPPDIPRTYSLDDAIEAYRQVDSGAAGGKVLFTFTH